MVAKIAEHAHQGRVARRAHVLDALERRKAGDTSVVDNPRIKNAIDHVNRRAGQDCGCTSATGCDRSATGAGGTEVGQSASEIDGSVNRRARLAGSRVYSPRPERSRAWGMHSSRSPRRGYETGGAAEEWRCGAWVHADMSRPATLR